MRLQEASGRSNRSSWALPPGPKTWRDVRTIEIPDLVVEELWVILRIFPPPDRPIETGPEAGSYAGTGGTRMPGDLVLRRRAGRGQLQRSLLRPWRRFGPC